MLEVHHVLTVLGLYPVIVLVKKGVAQSRITLGFFNQYPIFRSFELQGT